MYPCTPRDRPRGRPQCWPRLRWWLSARHLHRPRAPGRSAPSTRLVGYPRRWVSAAVSAILGPGRPPQRWRVRRTRSLRKPWRSVGSKTLCGVRESTAAKELLVFCFFFFFVSGLNRWRRAKVYRTAVVIYLTRATTDRRRWRLTDDPSPKRMS